MARVPVHRQISNMVSHLAQIPVGAGVRIRPKLSKPLPPGVERLFFRRQPTTKKPELWAPALTTQGDELESAVQFAA